MDELIEKAEEYWRYAAVKSNAHHLWACCTTSRNKTIGVLTVVLNAVVGTAIFTSLSKQNNTPWIVILVGLISVSAVVLAALQAFLKDSELSEGHRSASNAYEALRHRLDIFLLRYRHALPESREVALKEFEEVLKVFDDASKNTPTLPDKLWRRAKNRFDAQQSAGSR